MHLAVTGLLSAWEMVSCDWVVERLGDGWKKSLIALRFVGGACIDQLQQTDVQFRTGVRA